MTGPGAGRAAARGLAGPLAELRWREPPATRRAILRRAFDLGVTHSDLADNYGS
jgi:aryl-alcohol dehydrogenase-like predicted oxidoreductase